MKKVDKPWGNELWFIDNEHYLGKVIFVKNGCRLSKQYHNHKQETFFSIKGKFILEINGTEQIVDEKMPVTIFPKDVHRVIAAFGDVEIIEISTPFPDDIVRLEDDYKR